MPRPWWEEMATDIKLKHGHEVPLRQKFTNQIHTRSSRHLPASLKCSSLEILSFKASFKARRFAGAWGGTGRLCRQRKGSSGFSETPVPPTLNRANDANRTKRTDIA